MSNPVEVILTPALMILLGFLLRRMNVLKPEDSNTLSMMVLYVTLPALIFVNMSTSAVSGDMLYLPAVALLVSLVCLGVIGLYCKSRGYSRVKSWTLMIAASMINTGFIGFPITLGVFGNDGFVHAIFFDISTTILFVVFGMILVTVFGGNRGDVIRRSFSFVPLWAVVLALMFNLSGWSVWPVLVKALDYLGQATIPLIMISVGLTLNFKDIRYSVGDSLFVSCIRLVLSPVIAFIILTFFNIGGLSFNVGVLEAGMCTAMNALVLSINYDLDTRLMSSIIFITLLLSFVSLTVLISVIT